MNGHWLERLLQALNTVEGIRAFPRDDLSTPREMFEIHLVIERDPRCLRALELVMWGIECYMNLPGTTFDCAVSVVPLLGENHDLEFRLVGFSADPDNLADIIQTLVSKSEDELEEIRATPLFWTDDRRALMH
ncbi:MAG TPA: hypothetical protein PLP42_18395 [Acidobacteriota bacterium]|nr:hypothetical protein [Acidobacteriota bacterium]